MSTIDIDVVLSYSRGGTNYIFSVNSEKNHEHEHDYCRTI